MPGYASRTARPHRHNPASFARLRDAVIAAFTVAGATDEMAEQSWYIFGTSIVSWLAAAENSLELGEAEPRFDLFLDALLRGLPAREPATARPPRRSPTAPPSSPPGRPAATTQAGASGSS